MSDMVTIALTKATTSQQLEANAKVIAAAPDMLAALLLMIELPEIHEAVKQGNKRAQEALHAARSAIAKSI